MADKRKDNKAAQVRSRKLLACINSREFESIEELLKGGVDFAATDKGDAAIHLAARSGLTDVIDKLLRHGDNVRRTNQYGNTAMHYAVRNGHMTTVKFLKEKGATVNDKNEDGDTPLHIAVMYQPMDVIEKLVQYGMKVNTQNEKGETPLHVAVAHNRTEAMEALLIYKAQPDIKDKKGNRASDVAKSPTVATQIRMFGDLMAAMNSGYIHAEGIAVEPNQTSLQLKRVGIVIDEIKSSERLPYQLYCRREKTENSVVQFPTEKSEEVLSDIYHFRVTDAIDEVRIQVKIPLYSSVGIREQLARKFIDGRTEEFEETITEGEV